MSTMSQIHPPDPAGGHDANQPELPHRDQAIAAATNAIATRHQVLAALHAATKRAKLPARWEFVRSSDNVRRFDGSTAQISEMLQHDFSVEQLMEVGVFERSANGAKLNAKLAVPSVLLLFEMAGESFLDVVTGRGAVSLAEPPAIHYASLPRATDDHQSRAILLAATDDDVQLLISLGFHTRWCTGLERLSGENARKMFEPNQFDALERKYHHVLVAGQIAAFDHRPHQQIKNVLDRLCQLRLVYGFDESKLFSVWMPPAAQLKLLRQAASFRDVERARAICREGLSNCLMPPADAQYFLNGSVEINLPTSRKNLKTAIEINRKFPGSQSLERQFQNYKQAYQQLITDKCFAEANAAADPAAALLWHDIAEMADRSFQRQSLTVEAQLAMGLAGVERQNFPNMETLNELLRTTDALIRIRKILLK
jgi:hypothetical protein